ncbi:MAG: HD family phosphohydrolase [Cyanophyceae cyanobacterium]
MKTLNFLLQLVRKWRRGVRFQPRQATSAVTTSTEQSGRARSANAIRHGPFVILLLALMTFTSIIGYRFYNQPQLSVGTLSPVRVEAPRDGSFEDARTTAEKRRELRTGTVPVLKQERNTTAQIKREVQQVVKQIDQLRKTGASSLVDADVLSLPTQQYLRLRGERQWQSILAAVESNQPVTDASRRFDGSQQAIQELQTYRRSSPAAWNELKAKLAEARTQSAQATQNIEKNGLEPKEQRMLLQLSDEAWQNTKFGIFQALERILAQGIAPGLPTRTIERTVTLQLAPGVPHPARSVASKLLVSKIRPNLTEDTAETKRRAEQVALTVEPVIASIKQGETIVNEGEMITQEDFVLLDGFGLSRRGINWMGLGLTSILVMGAIGIFRLVEQRIHPRLRCRDRLLLGLLSATVPLLAVLGIKYTSLPALGLLVSSFYSPALAVTHVLLLTGLTLFSTEAAGWEYILAGASSGLLAAVIAGKLRSRDELALLGGAIGVVQGGVYLVINLIISATAGTIWYVVLPGAIVYGLSGLAWSVVALGVSPYLESLFDLVTPIRLAELANPNRPLLKRLALQAPGTFQHTMFVASLAEAAARELHCNVELVRTGTLYHDIGKLHDPLGFIENQMGEPNKHDSINDPWISAQIIKQHVTEGLVMARRCGLPKAIQSFIPEHQGTLLISYFYFQAKHQAEQEGKMVSEDHFRYDGPIPQSRETGIVMLADGTEAALRSLNDADPQKALAMVTKIFKARWREHQLVDSGLKYEELPKIADVFIRVWQQYHHKRISYPKAALEPQKLRK